MGNWTRQLYNDGEMRHRDGRPWWEGRAPFWWHRCRTQTEGEQGGGPLVERCLCGAQRLDGGPWEGKNSRRRDIMYGVNPDVLHGRHFNFPAENQ